MLYTCRLWEIVGDRRNIENGVPALHVPSGGKKLVIRNSSTRGSGAEIK